MRKFEWMILDYTKGKDMKFSPRTSGESSGSGGGGTTFVKLKSGDSLKGVFRGEPYDYRAHWVGGKTEFCKAVEGLPCSHCTNGDQSAFKFRLNFLVQENGAWVAKIFEQGWKGYENLMGMDAAYQKEGTGLEKVAVTISRSGSTKNDTVYTFTPSVTGPISPEQEKQLSAVKLQSLKHPQKDEAPKSDAPHPAENSNEPPW